MRKGTEYKYGVDENDLLQITTESLIIFLKKHLVEDYEMMMDEVEQIYEPSLLDYEEWLDNNNCMITGTVGKYSIVSNIITKETGIEFEYFCDNNDRHTICYFDGIPKELETIRGILLQYFSELGVEAEPYIIEL